MGAISQETYNRALIESQSEFDELTGKTQKAKIQQDLINKNLHEGKLITESLLTPVERYEKNLDKLEDLLKVGAISQETYNRAIAKSRNELAQQNVVIKKFSWWNG